MFLYGLCSPSVFHSGGFFVGDGVDCLSHNRLCWGIGLCMLVMDAYSVVHGWSLGV